MCIPANTVGSYLSVGPVENPNFSARAANLCIRFSKSSCSCYITHHFSVVAHTPSLSAATSSGYEKYGANTSALNTTTRGPCLREFTRSFAELSESRTPDPVQDSIRSMCLLQQRFETTTALTFGTPDSHMILPESL